MLPDISLAKDRFLAQKAFSFRVCGLGNPANLAGKIKIFNLADIEKLTMKKLNNVFFWGGLLGLVFIGWLLISLDSLPAKVHEAATTSSPVAAVETNEVSVTNPPVDNVMTFADGQNNGTDGGFTLLLVTDRQWQFLKGRGLKLHFFGNVMDQRYPESFGPILIHEGFWDTKTHGYFPEDATPRVFWVALRTDSGTYEK